MRTTKKEDNGETKGNGKIKRDKLLCSQRCDVIRIFVVAVYVDITWLIL